jgi:hypothetical protein
MNEYRIKLGSFNKLNESVGLSFFDFLIKYNGGIYMPSKCDVYEPLKRKFDPNNFSEQLNWLLKPSGFLMFRNLKANFSGNIENKEKAIVYVTKNGQKVPFGNSKPSFFKYEITLRIKSEREDELILFLKNLYIAIGGDYAFLTLEADYVNQNFVKEVVFGGATIERFAGSNLNEFIPGVYWVNVYGKPYEALVNKTIINNVVPFEELGNGDLLLKIYETPDAYNSLKALELKDKFKEIVGGVYFFNKEKLSNEGGMYAYFKGKLV